MTHVKSLGLHLTHGRGQYLFLKPFFPQISRVEAFNEYKCDLDEKIVKICFDFLNLEAILWATTRLYGKF